MTKSVRSACPRPRLTCTITIASLGLYRSGHLKLDEIITARYSLEQVNEGYHDLLAGKNIRGVILHES